VGQFLQQARDERREYDLVFLDPPYAEAVALGPVLSATLVPVLGSGARVVFESDRRAPPELDRLERVDERRYGDTLIRIYASELSA
jgi:16S rRNA G966 N2-methylase RsmD